MNNIELVGSIVAILFHSTGLLYYTLVFIEARNRSRNKQ